MTVAEAAELIAAVPKGGIAETWADLGCGDGIFTRALATLLPSGSVIHAMDRDASVLRDIPSGVAGTSIDTHVGDFTRQPWPFTALDGILLANALHFVRDRAAFLQACGPNLRPGGRFLIVEYDTDAANPWVPHPISLRTLERTFRAAGYASIELLGTRPSLYRRAKLYAVVVKKR